MAESQQVKLGDIFYVPLSEEDDVTPKGGFDHRFKFCFVVGFSEYGFYVVYFLMNSSINLNYINTYGRLSCQYPLSHKDYPTIIKKDKDPSFLDLGHAREIEKERLISKGHYKGTLTSTDFKNIFEWLRNSDQYSPKLKKRYGWI